MGGNTPRAMSFLQPALAATSPADGDQTRRHVERGDERSFGYFGRVGQREIAALLRFVTPDLIRGPAGRRTLRYPQKSGIPGQARDDEGHIT